MNYKISGKIDPIIHFEIERFNCFILKLCPKKNETILGGQQQKYIVLHKKNTEEEEVQTMLLF